MKIREIITLVVGLAAFAGVVAVVKVKASRESDAPPAEGTAAGETALQTPGSDTRTKLGNGPAKISRVLADYVHKPRLWIMIDENMPEKASDLARDPQFHAYTDADESSDEGQWIPITVDYYDVTKGTIGILSNHNQIREPERGTFMLTRVPR
jgi:hypothetical protein